MRPIQSLGLALVLTLGGCAEMNLGMPGRGGMAGAGACPADDHQDWVGQRIDYLNDVALPEGTRVLFPTTPASDEANPARLNVAVDRSDRITRVYCG